MVKRSVANKDRPVADIDPLPGYRSLEDWNELRKVPDAAAPQNEEEKVERQKGPEGEGAASNHSLYPHWNRRELFNVGAKGGGAITTPPLNDRVFFIK